MASEARSKAEGRLQVPRHYTRQRTAPGDRRKAAARWGKKKRMLLRHDPLPGRSVAMNPASAVLEEGGVGEKPSEGFASAGPPPNSSFPRPSSLPLPLTQIQVESVAFGKNSNLFSKLLRAAVSGFKYMKTNSQPATIPSAPSFEKHRKAKPNRGDAAKDLAKVE